MSKAKNKQRRKENLAKQQALQAAQFAQARRTRTRHRVTGIILCGMMASIGLAGGSLLYRARSPSSDSIPESRTKPSKNIHQRSTRPPESTISLLPEPEVTISQLPAPTRPTEYIRQLLPEPTRPIEYIRQLLRLGR